jgi:hypothetical protein
MRQRDPCGAGSEEGLLDEEKLSQGMRWLKQLMGVDYLA